MKQSRRTLEGLVAAIRSSEQQAARKRTTRDRLLGQASEAALEVAALTEQARGLREILGGLDKEVYEQAFGEPFTGDVATDHKPSREQLLTDLHDLLAFLEATPEIPAATEYWPIDLPHVESDAERIAAVDAVAMFLGEDPKRSRHYSGEDKQQYGVERHFGHVKLYADVVVDREPDAPAADAVDVDQADAAAVAEDGGEALDERMHGMGEPAAEGSAGEQVMHAAAYSGPHFGLESAHAMCDAKGWLTEDVPLVTCPVCAALLLGDEVAR